jgi:hypothetical protein
MYGYVRLCVRVWLCGGVYSICLVVEFGCAAMCVVSLVSMALVVGQEEGRHFQIATSGVIATLRKLARAVYICRLLRSLWKLIKF